MLVELLKGFSSKDIFMRTAQMAQCLFLVDHKCLGSYNFIVVFQLPQDFLKTFFKVSEEKVFLLYWIISLILDYLSD